MVLRFELATKKEFEALLEGTTTENNKFWSKWFGSYEISGIKTKYKFD